MFNFIDTWTIIIIFALNTSAVHNSKDDLFNVGTVLFTTNDLYKKRWSRTNIEVLEVRRYFQNIIPSPSTNSLNGNYVNNLLKYFTNTFSSVKRETVDPGIADVMEKALSDVIGGYFKVWVLPVTKLTYYGGAVSQDNAVKVFEFYDKLKTNLNTDGSGWGKPSEIKLNTVAVTVVPFSHVPHTRSMKSPCERVAYYERSDTGLTIPTPYINWNDPPYSMFLPLKNESLVQLDSPSASKALLKYYDIAESCCHSKSPDACNEFDLRFQDWVSNNVVPHINDDKLYIAFGSLLSLLNKTNEFIEKASNLCEYECDKFTLSSLMSRLPPCMTSNKFLILILILILEIIWCIPALIYIICSRRKSKMKQRTKFFLDTFKRHRYHTVGRIDNSEERNNLINKKEPNNHDQICHSRMKTDNGVKYFKKSRERNKEVDTQCPSHTFKHSAGQMTSVFSEINNEQQCQCESVIIINEKTAMDPTHSSHVQSASKDITNTNQTNESFTKIHKYETTITKIIRDKSGSNIKPCVKRSSSIKAIQKIESKENDKEQELHDEDENIDVCPCARCIQQDQSDIKANRNAGLKETRTIKLRNNSGAIARTGNVTNRSKVPKVQPKVCVPKNIKLNQSKGLKLNSGEPLLEIRIDRPAAEITVDITNHCRRNIRPSKIPRLTATNAKGENTLNPITSNVKPCTCVQQTCTAVKKLSKDDSDVKRKMVKHNKLNVTL